MIQLIIHLFSTISNGFYYLFWTSYAIGKLISWIFCSAINIVSRICFNIKEAGTVFSEDFLLFFKDLIDITTSILDAGKDSILTSCVFLYSIVEVTTTTITELFTTGNIHTANVGQQCVNSFIAMMIALKNLFVIIGNGAWFILALAPTLLLTGLSYIYQVVQTLFEFCFNFFESVSVSIKEITFASVNYFLDVPLQAIIGCSFIILLFVYRRITLRLITWLTVRMLQYVRSRLLSAFVAILSTFRSRPNNNRSRIRNDLNSRTSTTSVTSSTPNLRSSPKKLNTMDENICVVCRDEQKNVVLMPCRHLCLCLSCSGSIRTCPLCRKPIRNTLSVYV